MRRKIIHLGDKEDKKTKIVEEEVEIEEAQEEKSKFLSLLSTSTELGFSISLPIAGGALIGTYLDKLLGTAPKMALSLIFLGTFLGAANIYYLLKESHKEEQEKKKKE